MIFEQPMPNGRALIFALLFVLSTAISAHASAVVKVYCTYVRPEITVPWEQEYHSRSVGSGFVIEGQRILTNAHVVANASFLQVQKEGDPNRYVARVLFAGHECDLALLEVEDPAFFESTKALAFSDEMPALKTKVITVGFPKGGTRVSITEGVVSRIEERLYVHAKRTSLLSMQTDAAINPGNSGGPVLQEGKVVGVAFQSMKNSSNIGYFIPMPIVEHFLDDVADGSYDGFPDIPYKWRNLENSAFRRWLGLQEGLSGVHIYGTWPLSGDEQSRLKEGDVLLAIDGIDVANDGSTAYGEGRIRFTHHLKQRQVGDVYSLEVLRGGQKVKLEERASRVRETIPWYRRHDVPIPYLVVAGLVFQNIDRDYLDEVDGEYLRNFRYHLSNWSTDPLHQDRKTYVILNRVLGHAFNDTISGLEDKLLDSINGVKIFSLEDVRSAFSSGEGEFHDIRFFKDPMPCLLPREGLMEAHRAILLANNIPEEKGL